MRINKFLARSGVASRRTSEKYVQDGRVSVNGKTVTDLATQVDEQRDIVRVDGRTVRPAQKKLYVLLHKPKGVITTVQDERGRKTVMDLVDVNESLFPVGRLDRDTEGLLLLTNDGEMANRLMHPRYQITKTYRVRLDKNFSPADLERLESGIELEDGMTAPCRVRYYTDELNRVELQIHEGRKRQVRRMFEALDYRIRHLKRVQYGPLHLKGVERGEWRFLKPAEINRLRRATKLYDSSEKRTKRK